jgi:hypothetical protein
MLSLRETLTSIGREPPITIPADLSMPCNSLRDFLRTYQVASRAASASRPLKAGDIIAAPITVTFKSNGYWEFHSNIVSEASIIGDKITVGFMLNNIKLGAAVQETIGAQALPSGFME